MSRVLESAFVLNQTLFQLRGFLGAALQKVNLRDKLFIGLDGGQVGVQFGCKESNNNKNGVKERSKQKGNRKVSYSPLSAEEDRGRWDRNTPAPFL